MENKINLDPASLQICGALTTIGVRNTLETVANELIQLASQSIADFGPNETAYNLHSDAQLIISILPQVKG